MCQEGGPLQGGVGSGSGRTGEGWADGYSSDRQMLPDTAKQRQNVLFASRLH